MTTDTRTEAERRYDAERDGTLYTKPEPVEQPRSPLYYDLKDGLTSMIALASAKPSALLLAVADYIADEDAVAAWLDTAKPEQVTITRRTHIDGGELADDPWTTYALGAAELDLNDSGGGSLILSGRGFDFQDSGLLFDLALLLSNATVQAALDRAADT